MSFHRARRCAGALRRQLPLPSQPNPATNEPTRKPLAATGCPASPPPRRCLAATCACLPPVCRRVLSLPSLLLPFLLLLACRLRERPLLLEMPSNLPPIDLPAGLPPWPTWPPKLSLLLLASGASCSIAPSWLSHPRRYAAASFAKFRASSRRLKPSKRKQTRDAARLCAASRHHAGAGARGCKAVLSSFHERAACSWLVVLRAGVMRGNPPTAAVRRSRSRITLASKARLPDPRLLSRLHRHERKSCSCGPRLQKRCWVRCGGPWRSSPGISPTTSDMRAWGRGETP